MFLVRTSKSNPAKRCVSWRPRRVAVRFNAWYKKLIIMERLPNIHPGELLEKDFLEPIGIMPYRLAKDLGITRARVAGILHGRRDITPDSAIRLGLYFGIEPEFWLNLQAHYNLVETRLARAENYQFIQPRRSLEAA